MKAKGHSFFVTAREKEVAQSLLKSYEIPFVSRGKGALGNLGKLYYLCITDIEMYKFAKRVNPDLFLSFGSPYLAHVSKMLGKKHIAFDDTEHSKFEHMMYVPFTDVILTPTCFKKSFGRKHLYFNSYMELAYLHPNRFQRDDTIFNKLGIKRDEKYALIRFVSWQAGHDRGQSGISPKVREHIINFISNKWRVFISAEGVLPEELIEYKLKTSPEDFHHVLAYASLYVGEGSTTASESSVLGIPNIYVNSLEVGYCTEQAQRYGLCIHLKDDSLLYETVSNLMNNPNLESEWREKQKQMLSDKIDLTSFMVWFIENYPSSIKLQPKITYQ